MKLSFKRVLIPLLLLAALCAVGIGALIWAIKDYGARIAPPGKDVDLETFFAEGPSTARVERYRHEGKEYVVLTGKVPSCLSSWIVLPSGPPVYIFDESGQLAHFVGDSGESSWLDRWIHESKLLATSDVP